MNDYIFWECSSKDENQLYSRNLLIISNYYFTNWSFVVWLSFISSEMKHDK